MCGVSKCVSNLASAHWLHPHVPRPSIRPLNTVTGTHGGKPHPAGSSHEHCSELLPAKDALPSWAANTQCLVLLRLRQTPTRQTAACVQRLGGGAAHLLALAVQGEASARLLDRTVVAAPAQVQQGLCLRAPPTGVSLRCGQGEGRWSQAGTWSPRPLAREQPNPPSGLARMLGS